MFSRASFQSATRTLRTRFTASPSPSRSIKQSTLASSLAAMKHADPAQAQALIKEGKARYLDVRTVEEYQDGHVSGSVNVPVFIMGMMGRLMNDKFLETVQEAFPDKDEPIVVACKSGARSQTAGQILAEAGYTDLTNLTGGFDLWASMRLPVTK